MRKILEMLKEFLAGFKVVPEAPLSLSDEIALAMLAEHLKKFEVSGAL